MNLFSTQEAGGSKPDFPNVQNVSKGSSRSTLRKVTPRVKIMQRKKSYQRLDDIAIKQRESIIIPFHFSQHHDECGETLTRTEPRGVKNAVASEPLAPSQEIKLPVQISSLTLRSSKRFKSMPVTPDDGTDDCRLEIIKQPLIDWWHGPGSTTDNSRKIKVKIGHGERHPVRYADATNPELRQRFLESEASS
jgi:hypothetical protein